MSLHALRTHHDVPSIGNRLQPSYNEGLEGVVAQITSRRHAQTVEHQLCENKKTCAYLLTPGLHPLDHQYHMDFDHCRLCAVFWDQREKIPCSPKYGLKD